MMNSYSSLLALWKQLGLIFLLLIGLSAWGTDNSYGMAIATSDNNIENLITNTSGLTPQEESLLVNTIKEIISNTKKPWYPDSFSPTEDITYSNALDTQQVMNLKTLAKTGMNVIEMVDKRLKGVQEERRRKKGRWGFLENMDDIPYRISTNSPVLVFEIRKYDCLNNDGVYLPSNASTNVPGSLWMQYSDYVYVPFNCPNVYDFDREQAAKEHQRLMARLRRAKRSSGDSSGNSQSSIVQVNLTLTNETFQKTLYNQYSKDYIDMTTSLTKVIDGIFNVSGRYMGVNDFSYRPGSVIATFHIEITGANIVSFVKSEMENAMVNGMFGRFMVNASFLEVGQFLFENAYYSQWGVWSSCSKTCGSGSQSRSRSCNSSVPLACAHEGPSVETQECYKKYCSNECSERFTGDRGNFSSPVVDGLYPRNADCVWQITVDENHTIVVQFEDFNLEKDKKCKYDYVAFYDGNYSTPADYPSRELLRFCGNSTPPHSYPPFGYPVNSSSNEITVHFKTDSTKQRLGFTAIWHKVLKYHLRIPKIKPQSVTVLSFIYNPWSTMKDAAIPLGRATTCPESWGDDSCYFFGEHNVISRIVSVFLSRDMEITTSDPILIKFEHILDETMFPTAYTGRKTCVTWDHTKRSRQLGAWTRRGCSTTFSNLTHTMCKCLHPGMFAVLGEMEPPPKDLKIEANVYFGCAVFLILVIATVHSLATKEKKTTGELFHLYEAVVSGILLVIFLTGAHVPAGKELCGFLTFFLYYLVLSQFTWMMLTVFWMHNFLKRFLAERVRIKIVYFVLGWGVPIILAGVAGKIKIDKNGHEDNVCWVSISGAGTVWGYGAPVFAMFIVNVAILVYLLLPVAKENYDCDKIRPRVVKEFLIMLSFILTWCLGVKVTLDDSFKNQYFFCMFLILQGAVNFNFCHESTELFWKEREVKTENEDDNEENNESSEKYKPEESAEKEKEEQKPRMTVKTLKNLNIYKENGVFVIEA